MKTDIHRVQLVDSQWVIMKVVTPSCKELNRQHQLGLFIDQKWQLFTQTGHTKDGKKSF